MKWRPCRQPWAVWVPWETSVWPSVPLVTRPWDSWTTPSRWRSMIWFCDEASCQRHSAPGRQWTCRSGVTCVWTIPWPCPHVWPAGRLWWAVYQVRSSGLRAGLLWWFSLGIRPLWWSANQTEYTYRYMTMNSLSFMTPLGQSHTSTPAAKHANVWNIIWKTDQEYSKPMHGNTPRNADWRHDFVLFIVSLIHDRSWHTHAGLWPHLKRHRWKTILYCWP